MRWEANKDSFMYQKAKEEEFQGEWLILSNINEKLGEIKTELIFRLGHMEAIDISDRSDENGFQKS